MEKKLARMIKFIELHIKKFVYSWSELGLDLRLVTFKQLWINGKIVLVKKSIELVVVIGFKFLNNKERNEKNVQLSQL
ncbi:hypothetical protein BpHYR1_025524 [Brachionus plicatilis]|uniref:Uncharacterized protein n=1 Tax=Brachionus plicatilis TaxID=10195 RepID=A0A3M7RBV3_BRAPC|nr:hypothetical protein BpHYR1_025524 [Brachionus plicatilis]